MSTNHNRNRDTYYEDDDFFDEEGDSYQDGYQDKQYGSEDPYKDPAAGRNDSYGEDSREQDYGDGSYDENAYGNGSYGDGSYAGDGYGDEAYGNDSYGGNGDGGDDAWDENAGNDYYGEGADDSYPEQRRSSGKKSRVKKASKKKSRDRSYREEDLSYDDGYGDAYDESEYDEKTIRKRKRRRLVVFIIEMVALLVVVAVLYAMTRVEKIGKLDISDTNVEENISDEVQQDALTGAMKGYRNIALFGVDSTEGELDQNTRSDAILILSINEDTGEAKLVSVYRDTLLDIGNGEINKANAAYAKGGPEQALNMLNTNLDLNITDFVTIGFGGLTDVINALGGIQIDVTEDEIPHLNNYQSTMAKELGIDYTEVTTPGLQTLDGLQATAYCRIRYTSGWDYKRAARQRAVFYATFEKAKSASASQISEIANTAFSEIYTSYDLTTLISDLSTLSNYSLDTEDSIDSMANGFPQQDLRIQSNIGGALGDCVIPRSLSENVTWLHSYLFDDSDYDVTQNVQDTSNTIDDMTKDAVPEEMTDADHA